VIAEKNYFGREFEVTLTEIQGPGKSLISGRSDRSPGARMLQVPAPTPREPSRRDVGVPHGLQQCAEGDGATSVDNGGSAGG
jgi:hypothetical protein